MLEWEEPAVLVLDEARVARRWSARSAELAPARAGVASRRPKG